MYKYAGCRLAWYITRRRPANPPEGRWWRSGSPRSAFGCRHRMSRGLEGQPGLSTPAIRGHVSGMFVVDEPTAEAIRRAYFESGEFSAVVELRRHFPGITDNENARLCVRSIASWRPLPPLPPKKKPRTVRARSAPR